METKGKCGPEIRRRKPDSRNSETHEWGFAGRSRFQIPHCEKLQKLKPGVSDSLYPRIMRNTRNGEERTRQAHGQSNQIQPNRAGSRPIKTAQGRFRIKAQAVRSNLGRTNLEFGRAGWLRGNAEWMNGNANCLSDRNTFFICFTDEHGSGLAENLRLSSLILAYSRLFSLIFA